MEEKIECVKCGWIGWYGDLIAPTSDHEPSCPECLGDDFVDVDTIISTTGGDGMNERVEIEDGTTWPNPYGEQYHDLMWKLIHAPAGLSQGDFYIIAGAMEAYNLLITHPAFTLKKVAKKISGIRKAIK